MGATFRESMAWLHTWAGVVLGALLFGIFWTGSLSVFALEIDRWMSPETRLEANGPTSFDRMLPIARELTAHSSWSFRPATEREPTIKFFFQNEAGDFGVRYIDPDTSGLLVETGTLGGTGFIEPFHYGLHLEWNDFGYWLVGLASMAMLVLLASGIIIHRKLFVDFFTFRRQRKLPRSSLDLHNLSGVLGLPFNFVITLSGLTIFFQFYFPSLIYTAYGGDQENFAADVHVSYERPSTGEPSEMVSLDYLMGQAQGRWSDEVPFLVSVRHFGDANAYIELHRGRQNRISTSSDTLYYDLTSGNLLHAHVSQPVFTAHRFIYGLHIVHFDHWPLRWLYFVLGLSGCVMIATGYIYWLETRRKRHTKLGLPGVRLVEGLTVGSVTGIVIATLAFFVANQLLPLGASFAGYERAALEVWAFYLVWLASFAHAWLRPGRAWREQCWAIAVLALLAAVLNWITTGDHLLKTVLEGYWPVAGMDGLLLAGAGVAIYAARKLSQARLAADEPVEPVGQRTEAIDAG